jgi:prevent-host-death family protein
MEQVGLFEAKNRLSELVTRAEEGEEITITRHGHPAARLIPAVRVFDREKARKAIAKMRRLRRGVKLSGLKIKDLINEGRP